MKRLLVIAPLLFLLFIPTYSSAFDYWPYQCEYFSVEIPKNCRPFEDTISGVYSFSMTEYRDGGAFSANLASVRVGLNGVDLTLNENFAYDELNESGYLNPDNPVLRFLSTFQVKKQYLQER